MDAGYGLVQILLRVESGENMNIGAMNIAAIGAIGTMNIAAIGAMNIVKTIVDE